MELSHRFNDPQLSMQYIHVRTMLTRVFHKRHFVKKNKRTPHQVTGGYLYRSYPEEGPDQTLGGPPGT